MQEAMDNTPDKNLQDWAEQGGPPALKAGLSGLFDQAPAIARSFADQILRAARQQSIRRNRMRWTIRYAIGSIAAAAAVVLIAVKTTHHAQRTVNDRSAAVVTSEDLNH